MVADTYELKLSISGLDSERTSIMLGFHSGWVVISVPHPFRIIEAAVREKLKIIVGLSYSVTK